MAANGSKMGIKNPKRRIFFTVELCSPSLTNWDGSGVMDCWDGWGGEGT